MNNNSIQEITDELRKEAYERRAAPSDIWGYASYGKDWPMLNKLTGGIQLNKMQFLYARMKHGKSMVAAALIPAIAAQAADAGKVVRVVSLEMSKKMYVRRMAAILAKVPDGSRILRGDWVGQEEAFQRYIDSIDYIATLPIIFWDKPIDTDKLERFIAGDFHAKGSPRRETFWWVLDHVGLLSNISGGSAQYQDQVATANKVMQICHDIATGLIIGHANRAGKDGVPSLSNISGTDQWGKNLDEAWALWRPLMGQVATSTDDDDDEEASSEPAIMQITQRDGPGGNVVLVWSKKYAQFREVPPDIVAEAEAAIIQLASGGKK